jgi:hypothetical protein
LSTHQQPPVPSWLQPAAAIVGFVMVIFLVSVVVWGPDVDRTSIQFLRIAMALGAGAFSVLILGGIRIQWKWVEAAGGAAVFLIVYTLNPAQELASTTLTIQPQDPGSIHADQTLTLTADLVNPRRGETVRWDVSAGELSTYEGLTTVFDPRSGSVRPGQAITVYARSSLEGNVSDRVRFDVQSTVDNDEGTLQVIARSFEAPNNPFRVHVVGDATDQDRLWRTWLPAKTAVSPRAYWQAVCREQACLSCDPRADDIANSVEIRVAQGAVFEAHPSEPGLVCRLSADRD